MEKMIMEEDLPANYPSSYVEHCTLRDGTVVKVRPIRPDDAPRLQEGMHRLSAQSIYLRFLETSKQISDEQAKLLSNLDYQTQMALVASVQAEGQEILIGVARYVMVGPQEPGAAEAAIIVGDAHQGLGCGTLLLDRLVRYATAHGVDTFVATVHVSNARILRFIKASPFVFERTILEPGVWQIRVRLNHLKQADQT